MATVEAVIFDFDGVLADTEPVHYAAFQAVAAEIGLTLTRAEYYARFLGLTDRDSLAALCRAAGRPLDARALDDLVDRKRQAFARLSQQVQLYDGVPGILQELHAHLTLAVASGAFHDEVETFLARAHVRPLFAAVVGADDVAAGKPAPDPFLRALADLNRTNGGHVAAAACVVIEDTPRGIVAAHAAGMRCVAVTTSYDRAALAAADTIIAHVRELRPQDLLA